MRALGSGLYNGVELRAVRVNGLELQVEGLGLRERESWSCCSVLRNATQTAIVLLGTYHKGNSLGAQLKSAHLLLGPKIFIPYREGRTLCLLYNSLVVWLGPVLYKP